MFLKNSCYSPLENYWYICLFGWSVVVDVSGKLTLGWSKECEMLLGNDMERKKAGLGRDSFQTCHRPARILPGPRKAPDQDFILSVIMRLVAPCAYPASTNYWSEQSWEAHDSSFPEHSRGGTLSHPCESWDELWRNSWRPSAGVIAHSQAAGLSWGTSEKCKSVSAIRTFQEIRRIELQNRTPCSSLWSGYLCYFAHGLPPYLRDQQTGA